MAKPILDAHAVRELLDYDPETGCLTWRTLRNGVRRSGVAGHLAIDGYVMIRVRSRMYRAHRLAWLHYYGDWPSLHVDHVDGNRSNNAITNLREASHSQNLQNRGMNKRNSSGYKGVPWHKGNKLWKATIGANGSYRCLGYFKDPKDAHAAYIRAAMELHGVFTNAG